MKMGLLKNFLHFFTLRQGTLLIAKLQLLLSGYIIIFLVLGLAHVTGIQEMIVRDTEDALEREALEEITSKRLNSQRMELAHQKAMEEMYSMYFGLVMTIIHFITSILLLYGALMSNRFFMAPWMMMMMTIIASLIISLFIVRTDDCPLIALMGGKANISDRLFVLFCATVCMYMWLVVYSTYKSLEIKKGIIHEVHEAKIKYALPISMHQEKHSHKNSIPQPYDV
ncbi:uncharacterized protein LOC117170191 [Belonocnema kinseyi]|uniref:uncharacterized protein LOC117170191 n=1 Tax=Belonocnema kinseyi TaxID=2817044 RepID=UPI00143DDFD7|nr:uncharacterized protein LOC117170191 [Belonocnema kinseyi]XP_033212672.1 uncharacterized protein LOC117170191 [Belonocnema kinseyi]